MKETLKAELVSKEVIMEFPANDERDSDKDKDYALVKRTYHLTDPAQAGKHSESAEFGRILHMQVDPDMPSEIIAEYPGEAGKPGHRLVRTPLRHIVETQPEN